MSDNSSHEFFCRMLDQEMEELSSMIKGKNSAYGNSALAPISVFSSANVHERLCVRIDDKISRVKSSVDVSEDTVLDLIGYLVLLRLARRVDAWPRSWDG